MARISKLATLHPVRREAVKLGLYTICDFCVHSKFVDINCPNDGLKVNFELCLLDESKTQVPDCSQFSIDDELLELNEEEREFYEKKSLRRS